MSRVDVRVTPRRYDDARGDGDGDGADAYQYVERPVDHLECCSALDGEVVRFADVMSSLSLDVEITTCPGWTVVDLAEHLGVIHRWAEELVRLRSPQRIPREPPASQDDVNSEWIAEGGRTLVATLLAADPNDAMWAWGLDQHVAFWSRRQLHETLVHRMDLELAAGIDPSAEPTIAADAIDEYLSNIEKVGKFSPELSLLRGHGEKLTLRANDAEALWTISLGEDGFSLSREEGDFDTELVGSALDLLLLILGRRAVDQGPVNVIGERRLIDFWLAHSAFD
jgi:uncharacterized protein (TIGR03083 family)